MAVSKASWQTTIKVDGMTCKSCVQSIEQRIGDDEGVKAIAVSLESNTATISFNPFAVSAQVLSEKIEEMGFDATVVDVEKTVMPPCVCVLLVEGMTCQSCVKSIEDKLKDIDGVCDVTVSLSEDRAVITHQSSVDRQDLRTAVYDLGFDVEIANESGESGLEGAEEEAAPSQSLSGLFKAVIAIEGMTCHSCVNSITDALNELGGVMSVEISLDRNEGVIKYIAEAVDAATLCSTIYDRGFDAELVSSNPGEWYR